MGLSLPVHNPVLIFAIAMAAFLILPLITDRFRLPGIIGILVAGMIVGPHGTGLLERDETIELLGTVGLLYLVFLAGLEVDLADLKRKRGRAVTFGVLTFLVPQVLGTIGGIVLFDFGMATALLLGSVFSSHSFLALLIAKRLGLTEREMSIAVIGGTVITDTLALLVLAGVSQSTEGQFGVMFLVRLLVQAGLFTAVLVFGLPILGRWFFRNVSDGGAHFAFMMTVLFTAGFVAHEVGLEPIIGAFLAGLAMNRLVPHEGVLANRAFFIGNTIFVPFFLLSVGMLIDLGMVIGDLRTIEMAIFMTVTVILCKGGAAWLMRVIFGYSRGDAVVAWGLSLPQAATTLAVVLVGHDLKLFDDAILNATIVMVLVTCVLGPILVEVAGRRLLAAMSHEDQQADLDEDDDFQRIMIPLSNPESSDRLLDLAISLRRPMNDEALLPLSVAGHESAVEKSERLIGSSSLHLSAAEVPFRPVIRVDPNPVNGILRGLSESRATCVILGWAGPQTHWQRNFHLNRGLIDEVVADTTGQVLVVRNTEPLSVIERVVVVIPELAHAEPGFRELIADLKLLTKRIGAQMTIVTERPLPDQMRQLMASMGSKCTLHFDDAEGDLQERLSAILPTHTLLVVIGCREGTLSWSSSWSRMKTQLAYQHSERSLLVAYPRVERRLVTRRFTRKKSKQPILEHAIFHLDQQAEELERVIRDCMPSTVRWSSSVLQELCDGVSALTAEVALVHAVAPGGVKSSLTVVVLREPIVHEALHVRVLLILINPPLTSPHQHLEHLSVIAQAVGHADRLQLLLAAQNEGQARSALLDPLPSPDADDDEEDESDV